MPLCLLAAPPVILGYGHLSFKQEIKVSLALEYGVIFSIESDNAFSADAAIIRRIPVNGILVNAYPVQKALVPDEFPVKLLKFRNALFQNVCQNILVAEQQFGCFVITRLFLGS